MLLSKWWKEPCILGFKMHPFHMCTQMTSSHVYKRVAYKAAGHVLSFAPSFPFLCIAHKSEHSNIESPGKTNILKFLNCYKERDCFSPNGNLFHNMVPTTKKVRLVVYVQFIHKHCPLIIREHRVVYPWIHSLASILHLIYVKFYTPQWLPSIVLELFLIANETDLTWIMGDVEQALMLPLYRV